MLDWYLGLPPQYARYTDWARFVLCAIDLASWAADAHVQSRRLLSFDVAPPALFLLHTDARI